MRRSLAPSQASVPKKESVDIKAVSVSSTSNSKNTDSDDVTISRQPLFAFLSIPDALKKQFSIPSGCKITKQSIELRKVKTLGPSKSFQPLLPGQYRASLPKSLSYDELNDNEEEDLGADELPTTVLPPFDPLVLWTDPNDPNNKVEVIPSLASKLRPHQREGVQFLFECTMGLRGFEGSGCILADDMGLGKTLMSITLMWTLLNKGFIANESAIRKVIIACPTSLVGNWDNEIRKWVGDGKCPTFPVKADPKRIIKDFTSHRGKGVLIISYETQRRYSKMFLPSKLNTTNCCDLLICDEAHKLKNAECGLSISLDSLPAKKRILLSGTPMQNELTEFFNMVDFCNPKVLGSLSDFRKRYERPILRAKEMDASVADKAKADKLQKELSTIVNEFILKRGNILNAKFLPEKLIQYVCCRMSPLQDRLYEYILNSKEMRHARDGIQTDTLGTIRKMINICSHPSLIADTLKAKIDANEKVDKDLLDTVKIIRDYEIESPSITLKGKGKAFDNISKPTRSLHNSSNANAEYVDGMRLLEQLNSYLDVSHSGKLLVLHRLMGTMRVLDRTERIVIVSNYTQTLDVIERMCTQNNWPFLRLDGTTAGQKRTKLVDQFNNPHSGAFAFLLSSKAGGCGINLIGGNRLVLFDPDWNPACDKQAAGRIWREGQQKKCFIYRFMSTGTIEEKIIQRQLSKEGLQNIVDDKEQVNVFSSYELKQLFISRANETRSDTHDTLRCKRCSSVKVLDINPNRNKFTPKLIEMCTTFIDELCVYLTECSKSINKTYPMDDFNTIKSQLSEGGLYPTLPTFSRRLRSLCESIDTEQRNCSSDDERVLPTNISIQSEFTLRWDAFVQEMMASERKEKNKSYKTSSSSNNSSTAADNDDDNEDNDDEYVEQEGCPEETDFNRWSHHCGTCNIDDNTLKRAMADDDSISFVFGLSVTWTLLSERVEREKESESIRKEEEARARQELNEQRRVSKVEKEKVAKVATSSLVDTSIGNADDGRDDHSVSSGKVAQASKKSVNRKATHESQGSEEASDRNRIESACVTLNSDTPADVSSLKHKSIKQKKQHVTESDDDDDDDFFLQSKSCATTNKEQSLPNSSKSKFDISDSRLSGGTVDSLHGSAKPAATSSGKLVKKKVIKDDDDDDDLFGNDADAATIDTVNKHTRPTIKDVTNTPDKPTSSSGESKRKYSSQSSSDDSFTVTAAKHTGLNNQTSSTSQIVHTEECVEVGEWACTVCTYENEDQSMVSCAMCQAPRVKKLPKRAKSSRENTVRGYC